MNRKLALLYAAFALVFCFVREVQLVHHFIVINRDYYPVWSFFIGQEIQYVTECLLNCTAALMVYNASSIRFQEI